METGNKIKIGDQVKYNGYEYFVEGMLDDKTYILSNPKKFGHTKEYRTIDEIEIMTTSDKIVQGWDISTKKKPIRE